MKILDGSLDQLSVRVTLKFNPIEVSMNAYRLPVFILSLLTATSAIADPMVAASCGYSGTANNRIEIRYSPEAKELYASVITGNNHQEFLSRVFVSPTAPAPVIGDRIPKLSFTLSNVSPIAEQKLTIEWSSGGFTSINGCGGTVTYGACPKLSASCDVTNLLMSDILYNPAFQPRAMAR